MSEQRPVSPATVSLYDARPFFEKALAYGVQNAVIDQPKLDAICVDAPKGMVQIARYFGTEYLRPELEMAKRRMVNLVSLYLEVTSAGDLRQAAESLRDHSFLSHSKGGSDLLRRLIVMPQTSHFGMHDSGGFADEQIPLLAEWSLKTVAAYQTELARRGAATQMMEVAIWLAGKLGMDVAELEEAAPDSEAVIRSALLTLAIGGGEMPDWVVFEKMVTALRKKYTGKMTGASGFDTFIVIPKDLPAHCTATLQTMRQSVISDLPKIVGSTVPARQLFNQTAAFMGRYFWLESGLNEVDQHDRVASNTWHKATGGHSDDGSLLTLFLCIAAGATAKTLLTERSAIALIRKIRRTGLKPDLTSLYIAQHAPVQHHDDYARLWREFVEEAQPTLQSDLDYALTDALALLRRECHVT
ncbi:MAG: hypothetical protein WCH35_04440 [Comamonadaceae bacterium]